VIRRGLLVAIAALALAAPAAPAATPDSGSIGISSPKVSWQGADFAGAYASHLAFIANDAAGQEPDCTSGTCDTFKLTIADGPHDVLFQLVSQESESVSLWLQKPDGSHLYYNGNTNPTTKLKIKKLAAGEYTLYITTNVYGTSTYTGSAEITDAPAAVPVTAPTVNTPPTQAAPTAEAHPVTLCARAAKASAKKLSRSHKLTVGLAASGPLSAVKATLAKGKKRIGTGALAKLANSGKLVLKLTGKKVKAGTYVLTVSGKDAEGHVVSSTTKVKVTR
jgi:hypothetical protein